MVGRRFYELDALRFIAAISVLLFHYTFRGFAADDLSIVGYPALAGASKYGYLGVDLFFIISGFVILMTATNKTAKKFVISRMVRLYPTFWICCTLTFVATLAMGGERYDVGLGQYVANLTMLNGFVGIEHVDGAYWSLLYEIRFYAMVFVVLLFRRLHNVGYYLGAWLFISVLAMVFDNRYVSVFVMPAYSAYFIAGAVFYMISTEGNDAYKSILLASSYALCLINGFTHADELAEHYMTGMSYTVIAAAITLFYVVFLLIALNKTPKISPRGFAVAGMMTYPLYLIHQTIGFMLINAFHDVVGKYVLLLGVTAAVTVMAYIINKGIDKQFTMPFKKWLENTFEQAERVYAKATGRTAAQNAVNAGGDSISL